MASAESFSQLEPSHNIQCVSYKISMLHSVPRYLFFFFNNIYSCNFRPFLANFLAQKRVRKLCEEFLEGVVLEVTFR
jgi:hypothetical protein